MVRAIKKRYDPNAWRYEGNIRVEEFARKMMDGLLEYKRNILPPLRESVIEALDAFQSDAGSEYSDLLMTDAMTEMLKAWRFVKENITTPAWSLKRATEEWGDGDPSKFPRNMKPGTWFENNLSGSVYSQSYIDFEGGSSDRYSWSDDDDLNQKVVVEMSNMLTKSDYVDQNLTKYIARLSEFMKHYLHGQGKSIRSEGVSPEDLEALAKSAVRRVMRKIR